MALECAYPKCPELGENKSMAVKPCDVDSCCGVLHHFCLVDWCTEMKIPELPSGTRYCWDCAVSLTRMKPAEAASASDNAGDEVADAPADADAGV